MKIHFFWGGGIAPSLKPSPTRWEGEPLSTGWRIPPQKKSELFHMKWRVLVHSGQYFCPCPRHKNVEYSAWSGDLVDVEDVLLGNGKYSVRVMGLVSYVLYYNASHMELEILKHNKIRRGGGNVPTPNSGWRVIPSPRYLRPCLC